MKIKSSYAIYDTTKKAWTAMLESIKNAEKSIYWEVYILIDDEIGNNFFDILIEKAKAGVEVKLVLDYWGSFWLSKKKIQELKNSGIDIRLFQQKMIPIRSLKDWIFRRTHRKILIIDEKIGFIGSVNILKSMEDWNDIHIKLKGKVVKSLLRSFAKSYISCGGKRKNVKKLLKYKYKVENEDINFIYDDAKERNSRARTKYIEALKKAKNKVTFFSPYYFPDKHFLKALWSARKKGIKIDLLIPFRSDIRIATYVAYTWFSLMNKMGVNIYMTKKMMHGKGVIVDDDWAMIGSSNLDHVSFHRNYEANIQLKEKGVVKKLTRIMKRWKKESIKLDKEKWEKRHFIKKIKEKVYSKIYTFLFDIKHEKIKKRKSRNK